MKPDEAYAHVARALDAGRAANAYVVAGPVRDVGWALAERVLQRLFCEAGPGRAPCGACVSCTRVSTRAHPDMHLLLPEKKSRVISVESMHAKMLEPMSKTSFLGGWKAGVVFAADRMNESSANAFLKLLEEPPARTLFLLLTDAPDRLLPTIVSRCQTLDVSDGARRALEGAWRARVLDVLADGGVRGTIGRCAAAGRLGAVLKELAAHAEELVDAEWKDAGDAPAKEELEALCSARYREFRADFVQTLLGWFRDLMAVKAGGPDAPLVNADRRETLAERAAGVSLAQCFRNVEAVEELAASFDRNIQEEPPLARFADRVSFGPEDGK